MRMKKLQLIRMAILLLCASGTVRLAWAGPPFITDDPEPVPLHHWEIYLASQAAHDAGGWSGTSPHVEVNYGALPNLQLHLIAPIAFSAPGRLDPLLCSGFEKKSVITIGVLLPFLCPGIKVFELRVENGRLQSVESEVPPHEFVKIFRFGAVRTEDF